MRIFGVLRKRGYFLLAVVSAVVMFFIFPLIQVQVSGGLQNLDLWYKVIPMQNLILVAVFSLNFGAFLSFQVYNFKLKTCPVNNKAAGVAGGSVASILGFFVPACPACISVATLLLPASLGISVAGFLQRYSSLLLLISVVFLVLGIWLLGGFKKSDIQKI